LFIACAFTVSGDCIGDGLACCLGGCIAAIKKNLSRGQVKGEYHRGEHQLAQSDSDQQQIAASSPKVHHVSQVVDCDMQLICAATFPFLTLSSNTLALPTDLQEVPVSSVPESYNSFIPDGLQRPPQVSA
jgi:hypothetical protein